MTIGEAGVPIWTDSGYSTSLDVVTGGSSRVIMVCTTVGDGSDRLRNRFRTNSRNSNVAFGGSPKAGRTMDCRSGPKLDADRPQFGGSATLSAVHDQKKASCDALDCCVNA